MTMKTVLSIIAAAAVALLSTQSFAQDKARADVKAETKDAAKKKELTPAGEGAPPAPAAAKDAKATSKPRTEVKAEAAAANKKHETPAGEMGAAPAKDAKSTKARADVKAEAAAANKKHETPAGEGTPAAPKK